ncbi:hypothetical protein L1887_59107 [Cichorium endivia]|nr:hypothetical protein L1887_59107 [Cichorium endivia]
MAARRGHGAAGQDGVRHHAGRASLLARRSLDQVPRRLSSKATNGEVLLRFFEVALEVEGGQYAQQAAEWVKGQGRMKFCRTVYRALNKVEPQLAKKTFTDNRSFYHPIAAAQIEKVSAIDARQSAGDEGRGSRADRGADMHRCGVASVDPIFLFSPTLGSWPLRTRALKPPILTRHLQFCVFLLLWLWL